MAASERFSLWLVPEGEPATMLQAVIDRLAGVHSGPTFPPHLTLLGGIGGDEADVVEKANQLAASVAPITLDLDGIDVDATYFQSLFATVAPSDQLLATRHAAEQAFAAPPGAAYRPHVSLLYGFYHDEVKRAIAQELRGTLPSAFVARTLLVNQSGDTVADWRCALRAELSGK